jgi:hypothetical protein
MTIMTPEEQMRYLIDKGEVVPMDGRQALIAIIRGRVNYDIPSGEYLHLSARTLMRFVDDILSDDQCHHVPNFNIL